jgi:hypothetical protein
MGILSDLLGGVAEDLYRDIPQEVKSLYTTPLTQLTAPDISFQPFTVTGPTGSAIQASATGTTFGLSPAEQALQESLLASSGQMFEQSMLPTAEREAAIYDRIRATQLPEEERQRLGLEERLASQGRLGVQSAMFGGTPEQLALAKAQEEAQNQAAIMAMQQAAQEQQQQAAMGGQFLQQAYTPQAAMLSAFSPALNVASMTDVARRQMGEYDLETQIANLEGALGQRTGLGSLYTGMFGGAGNLIGGLAGAAGDILGGYLSRPET